MYSLSKETKGFKCAKSETESDTSSSPLFKTLFHIIRTNRLSTVDNRYNLSKKTAQSLTKTHKRTKRNVS